MPRTATQASRDFDEVRYQRLLADRLRKSGRMGEEEWQARQNELAGKDRRYFAELATSKNPLAAIPLLAAIPGDYVAKKLGLLDGRSEPTLDSLAEGYRGMGQGLANWGSQAYDKLLGRQDTTQDENQTRAWSSPEERRRILLDRLRNL